MTLKKKRISLQEFQKFAPLDWKPVILENKALPNILRSIPKDKLCIVVASGSAAVTNPRADGNMTIPNQVGGIDVYRYAEESDGISLNKDWYRVIKDDTNADTLYLIGPVKDGEHWIDDIPNRLVSAKVIKE